jgi:hypothetical protein
MRPVRLISFLWAVADIGMPKSSIRIFFRLIGLVVAIATAVATISWMARHSHSSTQTLLVIPDGRETATTMLSERVAATDAEGRGALARVRPSLRQEWVFYLTDGKTRQRIWAIDHYEYDFMKDGDEPLHMFGTQLETGFVVAVYKEHAATRVSIIKKDDPPPKGTGMWQEAGTRTVIEDDDLDGAKVTKAEIVGHVADRTIQINLLHAKPGEPAATSTFTLQWTGGKPIWVVAK